MSYTYNRKKHGAARSLKPKCVNQKTFRQCSTAELVREAKRQRTVMDAADLFKLRAAGPWSKELLQSSGFGGVLNEQHLVEVKKILAKIQPKNDKELEEAFKQAQNTPQQRFLILNEASMNGPLTAEAFHEYLGLFKQILPQHWQQIYGNKTPAQITNACIKQMPQWTGDERGKKK